MLRGLSKVASTASAAASAAVVSVSTAAAQAEFPTRKYRERGHSRLAKPYPGPQYVDDDYDFCQDETYGTFIGGVPSQEEVDEATKDLQATFSKSEEYWSPTVLKLKTCGEEVIVSETPDLAAKDSKVGDYSESAQAVTAELPGALKPNQAIDTGLPETLKPSPAIDTGLPETLKPSPGVDIVLPETLKPGPPAEYNERALTNGGTSNVVARCVDLLQRDPDIQAAVVSLARDPAIWDAFVKNEKVQELLRAKNLRLPRLEGSSREASKSAKEGQENPFLVALMCLRNMAFDMMDSVVDMIGNVFGFFDQNFFGGKDSDPLDKPLKACMVLTILVLALVVLKRA